VKRTAETLFARHPLVAVVRFTDFASYSCHPTSELVGYFHSSAKRGLILPEIRMSRCPEVGLCFQGDARLY
jgi:hypothetical protein